MPEKPELTNHLRQRAEEALRGQPVDLAGLHPEDIQYLLHELQVHQVELRMQNDELRRVQLELENSRDRYSDLYHYAPTGYCTLDRKGVVVEANQTLGTMLGVDPEQLVRTPLSRFVDRADQDTYYLHRQRTFADGERRVSEIQMVKQPGGEFCARMESIIAPGEKNQIWIMLSDITERKRAEEALQETQERLRVALENAPISVFTTDREGRYTWIYNPPYGFAPENLLGKRDDELVPVGNIEEVTALKKTVLDSGVGQRQLVRFRVGSQILVHDMTVEPLRARNGEVVGLTVASMDVTQQQRVEKEAQESAAQREVQHRLLDQREQERQQIARDLHDGPVQELIATTFAVQGLLMGKCPPEMASVLAAIQTSLQEQINELRTYAGELRPPTLSKFGLEQAIRSHADTFQENHPELRIELDLHQTGEILPETIGLALFRIYQQALNNILKHAQASQVRVQMAKNEHQVELEILDNGQGFELPEDWISLARQGHLGLVGMRERAEAVGGRLNITSQPEKGARIQVWVPLNNPLG